jgi:malate dehydrogenase (oxaloacetate-decarboxylating)
MIKKKKDFNKLSIKLHKENQGKIEIVSKIKIKSTDDLSTAYSPGVAAPCLEIQKNPKKLKDYTINGQTIAVITDGSAVLGLGNIGPKASLPVMEGKSLLFKHFANLNSFPIALDTQDTEEFIKTVKYLAPSFAGINLEDISAPRCFEIEQRLKKELDIPVFHDDQHGTAIVVLAGLINSLKIVNKTKRTVKIVINGSGAAGVAITKLLHKYGFNDITVCDSKGIISKKRTNLTKEKKELLEFTNLDNKDGTLKDALKESDIFIGVSIANLLTKEDIRTMATDPIIFALANPNPEITPDEAKKGGAKIISTGRSDFPNQVNNVLVFPGIFKGAIEGNFKDITDEMKLRAANKLAELVKKPTINKIIPNPFEKNIAQSVANAVKNN